MGNFASECRAKDKINSVNENKPEGIYLSAFESDSKFVNDITSKTEKKNFPKLIAK